MVHSTALRMRNSRFFLLVLGTEGEMVVGRGFVIMNRPFLFLLLGCFLFTALLGCEYLRIIRGRSERRGKGCGGGNLGFVGECGVTGLIWKEGKEKGGGIVAMGTRDYGWVRVSFLLPFSEGVSFFLLALSFVAFFLFRVAIHGLWEEG